MCGLGAPAPAVSAPAGHPGGPGRPPLPLPSSSPACFLVTSVWSSKPVCPSAFLSCVLSSKPQTRRFYGVPVDKKRPAREQGPLAASQPRPGRLRFVRFVVLCKFVRFVRFEALTLCSLGRELRAGRAESRGLDYSLQPVPALPELPIVTEGKDGATGPLSSSRLPSLLPSQISPRGGVGGGQSPVRWFLPWALPAPELLFRVWVRQGRGAPLAFTVWWQEGRKQTDKQSESLAGAMGGRP